MQENVELVQKGFRVLLNTMSGYLGQTFYHTYKDQWWDEVLTTLSDQWDLPENGAYSELVDSLDIANCIRLLDRKWNELFRYSMSLSCRIWAKELMGIRNIVAHLGQKDLEQPMAERALDTMALLCKEMDEESSEEIRVLYRKMRQRAADQVKAPSAGLSQPESESSRGALKEGSLLQYVGTDMVQKTTMSRKVTFGGKTAVYPVYRVRLDMLFYNDQNDRIATWMSQYEAENGKDSLGDLNREIYNRIVEDFIVDSNPDSIKKTQNNIKMVGQKEHGVTLADGRIVDGNRRFTCLRRIQRDTSETLYFETVLLDVDIQADKKQIKLLELEIQHGEEKKVDYDLIDFAVGTYRDIVQTGLLTIDEYAASTGETKANVRKRIEVAQVVTEFLAYIKLPEQYHIARDYQVFSLFQEMMTPLHQLDDPQKQELKEIAFSNVVMRAIPDQRKFIRDIKNLVRLNSYRDYFEEQKSLSARLQEEINRREIRSRVDLDAISESNSDLRDDMQNSLERNLLRSRSAALKAQPSESVGKSMNLLMDIDPRLFGRLDEVYPMSRTILKFRGQRFPCLCYTGTAFPGRRIVQR